MMLARMNGGGLVVELFPPDPSGLPFSELLHPDLVSECREVPDDLQASIETSWSWSEEDGLFSPPPEIEVEDARTAQSKLVREAFNGAIGAGMAWRGKVLQVDTDSTRDMNAMVSVGREAGLPEGFAWRMLDNSYFRLDLPGLVEMSVAAAFHVLALRQVLWAKNDAIRAAETLGEVAAVNPLTDWPARP